MIVTQAFCPPSRAPRLVPQVAGRQGELGDEHGAAITYGQLGILAGLRGGFLDSAKWLIRCLESFDRCNDPHSARQTVGNLLVFFRKAPATDQTEIRRMWEKRGLGPFPELGK